MRHHRYQKASSRIAKRNKLRNFFSLFVRLGLPTAIIVGSVFLLRADFLQVRDFEVVGAENIDSSLIKAEALSSTAGSRFLFLPNSNIILLDKDKLASAITAQFSRLEKVEVGRKYFDRKVEIKVSERGADFAWCSQEQECFFMNREGLVFEKMSPALGSDGKLVFQGLLDGDPILRYFATPEKIDNYLRLVATFREEGFEITSIDIASADKAVAKSSVGDIIFDPEEPDLSVTGKNAILLINEVLAKNPAARFQYVDARFDNKFFYKLY